MINAKDAFSILGDGSDETAKLLTALNSGGDKLWFPPGVYGFAGQLKVSTRTDFSGAGPDKTIFKNLSPTSNGFIFPNEASPVYQLAEGFTLDMNGSSGMALYQGAQQSRMEDIVIQGQVGPTPAWFVEGATRAHANRVRIKRCHTGLKILGANYINFGDVFIETTHHRALDVRHCSAVNLPGTYLECDETPGTRTELAHFYGCNSVHLLGFGSEIPGPAGLNAPGYFIVDGCNNWSMTNWRIKHYTDQSMRSMFHLRGYNRGIHFTRGHWLTDKENMSFLTNEDALSKGVTVTNIVTNVRANCKGINLAHAIPGLVPNGWVDDGQPVTHIIP